MFSIIASAVGFCFNSSCKKLGKLDLNSKDYITIDPRFFRAEELKYLRGDSSKLRETLGWEPEFTFETLMDDMIQHWLKIYE